ncbi:uncharacterized protein LOC143318896 isoform X2 [Chaetodon auriga]
MRVLVVFLLLGLCCSQAEGRLVSKCELRDVLTKAIGYLPERVKQRGLSEQDLVAKIVCHVEFASGFNTSAINELTPGMDEHHNRGKRGLSYGGMGFSLAMLEDPSVTIPPHIRGRRHAMRPTPNARPPPPTSPPHLDDEVWTLYGLFQLSNHLVCSDGTNATPNICMTDCSNLTDDVIHDDISCLIHIFTYLLENGFGATHLNELRRMIRLIYQRECRAIQASDYFSECS